MAIDLMRELGRGHGATPGEVLDTAQRGDALLQGSLANRLYNYVTRGCRPATRMTIDPRGAAGRRRRDRAPTMSGSRRDRGLGLVDRVGWIT